MSEKRIISALLCAVLAMCAETASRADQYIIPTPQRAVYHDAFLPLDCARIVVSDKPPKEVIFGVKQLNARITELGGKPMPVIGSSEYARDSVKAGVAIMIGATSDAFLGDASGKWRTAEGYAISTTPNNVVICRGYDDRGAYYAIQSLIQLLSARKSADGKVSVWLREADIEDWPAFKLRILPYVAWAGPEYMEWVAQYKLNVAGIHYPVGKQWRNPAEDYLDKADAACVPLRARDRRDRGDPVPESLRHVSGILAHIEPSEQVRHRGSRGVVRPVPLERREHDLALRG